jgi:enterobactin synthetase component D
MLLLRALTSMFRQMLGYGAGVTSPPLPLSRASYGSLAVVAIDDDLNEGELAVEERAHYETLGEVRRRTWLAGRVALRRARGAIESGPPSAVLVGPRGAPLLPPGISGSIAHKETIAVALAAAEPYRLGVDVEYDRPSRVDISRRILTDRELGRRSRLNEAGRSRVVRVAFAVKEAIYKAIDPFCARYVGFHEVELELGDLTPGDVEVRLALAPAPFAALEVRASWEALESPAGEPILIAMARAEQR